MPTPTTVIREHEFAIARKAAGLTSLDKLATAMGLHRSSVHRTISGKVRVSGEFIAGAEQAFPGCSFDDLFERVATAAPEAIPA